MAKLAAHMILQNYYTTEDKEANMVGGEIKFR
jgi:hypothetical protein